MRTATELLDCHLRELPRDLARWRDLFAENAVVEFPYGNSASLPTRLVGPAAIAEFAATLTQNVAALRFSPPRLLMVEEHQLVAEYDCEGKVTATGRPYQQRYLAHLRCEGDKISLLKEYFDPTRVIQAFY